MKRGFAGRTAIERAGFLAAVVGLSWLLAMTINRVHYTEFLSHLWGVALGALFVRDYFYGGGESEALAARLSIFGLFARFAAEPLLRWLRTGSLRSQ